MGMCSLFKTVNQILQDTPSIDSYLIDADKYWAHRDANNRKEPEKLSEHIALVNENLLRIVEVHQLDGVMDRLIDGYLSDLKCVDNSLGEDIKRQYIYAIVFHDHGKINELFQADSSKMNNLHFKSALAEDTPLSTNHSQLSAFIYLAHELQYISKVDNSERQKMLIATAINFSYSILKHHSPKLNDDVKTTLTMDSLFVNRDRSKIVAFMYAYLTKLGIDINLQLCSAITSEKSIDTFLKISTQSAMMFGLLKLSYSLLTASDYLATNEYVGGSPTDNMGVLSVARIDQIYHNVSKEPFLQSDVNRINFNAQTYSDLATYTLINPTKRSGNNLNILRKEMGIELLRNLNKNRDEHLFYIEAPTGGGKTNLSALAAIELLKNSAGALNKVFYVFPFTTLITQTTSSLKRTFGLQNDEIIELHSRAAFTEKSENDGTYGKDRLNYIANLFVNYPICLLSHIAFFDILKTNRKEKNYLLHRLANSVVVIDELQSYNPKHWDKIIYFIRYYAKIFNIKFILMSATLPKLDKLVLGNEEQGVAFVNLIPNAREKYFQNPNFCDRIDFDFEYFERDDLTLQELAERVILESEKYALLDYGKAKPKDSVYTIIEFIFKKSATEFYNILKDKNSFDEIFVLSGTILEHRRQYIINYLKNYKNRRKKVLLITTQVVEAGVDIDMDIGFKDRSLIDSDEQLAGRINRNVNKENCKLFLFNYNKESLVYKEDARLQVSRKNISTEQYKEILKKKDFDKLYNLVIDNKNKWNNTPLTVSFSSYEQLLKQLKFERVQTDFQLIESRNISCFIPVDLPLKIGEHNFFSKIEIDFLAAHKIYPNGESKIEGEKVFNIYLDFVHNKVDFISQKIREKVLQSILSKFVISLFASPKVEQNIIHFCDMEKSEYGYFYVDRWEDFYSEEGGMDASKFNGVEETQFL